MDEEKEYTKAKITENTLVSWGFVFVLGMVIFWAALAYAQTNQNTKDIADLKIAQTAYNTDVAKINKSLNEIKGIVRGKRALDSDE